MFLLVVGHNTRFRVIKHTFRRSTETIIVDMSIKGAYFKSCTNKGTIDFIFGSTRLLDGVGLEVDNTLDGADFKYICSSFWSFNAPWLASMVNMRRSKLNYTEVTSFSWDVLYLKGLMDRIRIFRKHIILYQLSYIPNFYLLTFTVNTFIVNTFFLTCTPTFKFTLSLLSYHLSICSHQYENSMRWWLNRNTILI